jgi:hypothetical protein
LRGTLQHSTDKLSDQELRVRAFGAAAMTPDARLSPVARPQLKIR